MEYRKIFAVLAHVVCEHISTLREDYVGCEFPNSLEKVILHHLEKLKDVHFKLFEVAHHGKTLTIDEQTDELLTAINVLGEMIPELGVAFRSINRAAR